MDLTPVDFDSEGIDSVTFAQELLGMVLVTRVGGEEVALRVVEVEAYGGVGEDPGSHAFRGRTKRNTTMFGPPGHLYVYRSYGVHWCANIVSTPSEVAGGVLLRAGEVLSGIEVARRRRRETGVVRSDRDLARGPGRLGAALGITDALDGARIASDAVVSLYRPTAAGSASVGVSTRTGVAGAGSTALHRYFLRDDRYVSPHRPTKPNVD